MNVFLPLLNDSVAVKLFFPSDKPLIFADLGYLYDKASSRVIPYKIYVGVAEEVDLRDLLFKYGELRLYRQSSGGYAIYYVKKTSSSLGIRDAEEPLARQYLHYVLEKVLPLVNLLV